MPVEDIKPLSRPNFIRGFVDHPASVDETYMQHALFALTFAAKLFVASLVAFVHALVPPLFETTASRMIRAMHTRIAARH